MDLLGLPPDEHTLAMAEQLHQGAQALCAFVITPVFHSTLQAYSFLTTV
jgi:hypothetical protein